MPRLPGPPRVLGWPRPQFQILQPGPAAIGANYTFLAYDLRTNTALAELPLAGVTFSRMLNGAGSLRGVIPLGDRRVTALDWEDATQPARTALFVDRNGVLVWGGIIWTRGYQESARALSIGAMEFWSYFAPRGKTGRFITDTKVYAASDQLFIARDLINYAQAKTGGNIGVIVGAEVSGVNRTITYNDFDFNPVARAIEQLAALDGGFDFSIDVAYEAGVPAKHLNLSYPRRGIALGSTGLVFEHPGNLVDFHYPEDGTEEATDAYAIGSGSGAGLLRSHSSAVGLIDGGYPLLEFLEAYKNETSQPILDAHARADVVAHGDPVTLPELTVRADADPMLGSYSTGDDVLIVLESVRFPGPADSIDGVDHRLHRYFRITGYEVTPARQDGQYERVRVILGATASPLPPNRVLRPDPLGVHDQTDVLRRLHELETQA